MKVTVITSRLTGKWTVQIKQGVQYFTLDYDGTHEEADWMAKMFRIAIRRHDREVFEKQMLKKEPGGK